MSRLTAIESSLKFTAYKYMIDKYNLDPKFKQISQFDYENFVEPELLNKGYWYSDDLLTLNTNNVHQFPSERTERIRLNTFNKEHKTIKNSKFKTRTKTNYIPKDEFNKILKRQNAKKNLYDF